MADGLENESSISPLQAWIEEEQAKAYESLSPTEQLRFHLSPAAMAITSPFMVERIIQQHFFDQSPETQDAIRVQIRDFSDNKKESPIRRQNQHYYRHLNYYWDLIQEHSPELTLNDSEKPMLATLPIPQFNAATWKLRGHDRHAIVFNETLLTFLFLLSKIVARYFPGQIITQGPTRDKGVVSVLFDRKHVDRVLRTEKRGLQDFINLLTGHVHKGDPLGDTKPYLLDRQASFVAAHLISFSEMFVFAHELSHIVRGDLVGAAIVKFPGLDEEFDFFEPDQQQELNADAEALRCIITACEKISPPALPLAYMGPELFLSALDLSERAVTFVAFGEERKFPSDTHPSVEVRRSSLRKVLRHHVTRRNALRPYPEAEIAISQAELMVDLIDALWREARELLERARSITSRTVSPRWAPIIAALGPLI
jgi:hypothetical protein